MAGSDIATSPYHTITPKGVGWVVGFEWGSHWGYAVGYDWDLPSPAYSYQIHFIPTYRKCLQAFYHGWQSYLPQHHTIAPKGVGWVVGF